METQGVEEKVRSDARFQRAPARLRLRAEGALPLQLTVLRFQTADHELLVKSLNHQHDSREDAVIQKMAQAETHYARHT